MAKAPKIVISHRLHEDGMKVLEDAGAEVVIVGSGEPADMLPYLKDADASSSALVPSIRLRWSSARTSRPSGVQASA